MKKLGSLLSAMAFLLLGSVVYAATIVVVYPGDMQGWTFASETGATGTGAMVNGPATPPLGSGSAQLTTSAATDGVVLALAGYQGTRLDEITSLDYSTYRTAGGPALAIALQFNVDADVTDANTAFQGRLVYEPYYTQAVFTNVWQTWTPQDNTTGESGIGNWWFSNGGLAAASGCSIASPCTWDEVLTAFPNAGVHPTLGAVILKAGSGWTGFDGNVDDLTIGVNGDETTYDFELDEPLVSPTSKDACKNDGWMSFNNPTFKNQGDCVSWANYNL